MRKQQIIKSYIKTGLLVMICMAMFSGSEKAFAEPLITTEAPETNVTETVTTSETVSTSENVKSTEEVTSTEQKTDKTDETITETEKPTEEQTKKTGLQTPKNVQVSEQAGLKAKLTWKKVSKATGYVIYRSTKKTKGYKKIGTAKKNSFTDSKVKSGTVYYYKVSAVKRHKAELSSEKSEAAALYMKPIAPSVYSQYVKKKLKLSWKKVRGAETYYVYKKTGKGKYKKIGETEKLYFTDKKVQQGKRYYYKVKAVYKKDGKTIIGNSGAVCKALAMSLDPNKKMIALTFDDGPGRYTNEILDCLKQNNAKATFFVLGCNVDSYKNAVKRADKMGCEIGNHSYSHAHMNRLSDSQICNEISKTDAKIKKITGKSTDLIRVPGGILPANAAKTVNKPIILWSIDTRDWETRNKKKTVDAVLNNVRDGDIVLMHDIYEPTKEAACTLIVELRNRGYQLVTVSELAKYREITLKKGNVYHSLRKK